MQSPNLDVQNLERQKNHASYIMQNDMVGTFDSSNSAREMTIINAGVDPLLLCTITNLILVSTEVLLPHSVRPKTAAPRSFGRILVYTSSPPPTRGRRRHCS